jgi:hypothetical protein
MELGPQRNFSAGHLADLRGLPARTWHSRLARQKDRLATGDRIRRNVIHLLRREFLRTQPA